MNTYSALTAPTLAEGADYDIMGRNGGPGRKHVKSGCRTCKIRRIKCDEAKPACQKCVSTGRVCDGYGIWGGGSHGLSLQNATDCNVGALALAPQPAYVPVLVGDHRDQESFAWFKHRTSVKLPGSFRSEFWRTLLLQVSLSEPAVLHAVLALSSVHRGGVLRGDPKTTGSILVGACERSTLQHYCQAIRHLQPHFSVRDRLSFRTTLITCLVFISIDLLRGHFATAHLHYLSGLRLFMEIQSLSGQGRQPLMMQCGQQTTDDWIEEAFCRLHVHMQLFQHMGSRSQPLLKLTRPQLQSFSSFKEAWRGMDCIMNNIFDLGQQARDLRGKVPSKDMVLHQQGVNLDLGRWLRSYQASKQVLIGRQTAEMTKVYRLLLLYHDLAMIMSEVCLYPNDESVFDAHTKMFNDILKHASFLRPPSSQKVTLLPPAQGMDMSRSVTDVGWIAPLYYTAVKCRVHRVRLQAVRLLETSSSREGVWDPTIAALVARKVMQVEEGDSYEDIGTADDFPAAGSFQYEDLHLPTLPDSRRIRDVEVVLLGDPLDTISVCCTRREELVDRRYCIGEYHVASHSWRDVGGPEIA